MSLDTTTPEEDAVARRLQLELRTPLTAIWGRVQLLQRRLRRNTTLSPAEGEDLLANLAMITTAIEAQRRTIDAMHHGRSGPSTGTRL